MKKTSLVLLVVFILSASVVVWAQITNVLNPASDLAGKTLVTAEGNRTISGTFTFTSSPLMPTGTAAAPGLAGSVDTTTGLQLGLGTIGFSLGGVQRGLLNSSGLTIFGTNVIDNTGTVTTAGLGTGAANTTVFLRGDRSWSNTLTGSFIVGGSITAGSGVVGIVGADGRIPAISTTYVASLSGANLTSLPAAQLTGTCCGSATNVALLNAANTFTNTGTNSFAGIVNSAYEYRLASQSFSRVAIVDSAGGWFGGYNVKGNAQPSTQPQHDSTGVAAAIYPNSSGIDFLTDASAVGGTSIATLIRMRILPSGGVNIGATTDPGAANLNVTGTIQAGGNWLLNGSTGYLYGYLGTQILAGYTNGANSFYSGGSGGFNVINQAGGSTRFSISDDGTLIQAAFMTGTGTIADVICMTSGGQFIKSAASTCVISSERFKHDIVPFTGDALAVIQQIQPVTYYLNDHEDRGHLLGVIAERVQEIPTPALPSDFTFLTHQADGQIQGVQYEALTTLALRAIQQLDARVKQLEAQQQK
jgi:hypothetical protein